MDVIGVHELKKAIYTYCCGGSEEEKDPKFNEEVIITELLPVWRAFKKNGFDFYKFMVEKDYELIEDEEIRVEVLMWLFPLLKLPIGKFATDWLNGYLDFFKRETDEFTDTEVLRRLFFCSTDKDIWKMMVSGVGDIESLYRWYMGMPDPTIKKKTGIPCYYEKDEKKAAEFLEYLLDDKTNAMDGVREEAMRLKSI